MRGMERGWQWLVFFLRSFINRIKMDCPVIISLSGMITTVVSSCQIYFSVITLKKKAVITHGKNRFK